MQTIAINSTRQLTTPPTVKGFPVLGALPQLLRKQLDFLEEAQAKYGDIYTLNIGPMKMIMLNRPEHAQHVLRDHARNYLKGGAIWDSIRTLLGNGLVVSEGDFWLRQRRMMQPHFHRQRLGALTEVMVSAIEQGLASWIKFTEHTDPVEVTNEFSHITMNIITRTMFGSGISDEDFASIGSKFAFLVDYLLTQAVTQQLPAWLPNPKRTQFQEYLKDVDDFINNVIQQRRENLSNDLLSMLLETVDDESGEQMTNQQLRDEVLTIFAAGYETTAITLTWIMDFLVNKPDILARLREEVDTVLGQRTPTMEDLQKLTYTRQVLQESMRLRPPAYFVTRTAAEDDVIDGYHIPAGSTLAITMYTIHRHPEFWPEPLKFDPDRFAPELSEKRHPMAWIPFGAGQRMCLGRDFAYMEGTLILAMLVQRFNVQPQPGFVAKPKLSSTLRPEKGVLVKLQMR
jgi:cytochrome P450